MSKASDFVKRRAGAARPEDMLPFLDNAKGQPPPTGDELEHSGTQDGDLPASIPRRSCRRPRARE